ERVAPAHVAPGVEVVQRHEGDDRTGEVNAAVAEVPEPDEPRIREKPLLNGALVVDPEPLLPVDDLAGVVERVGARDPAETADPAVPGVRGGAHACGLERPPPAERLAARSGGGWSRRWGHGGALQ